MFALRSAGSILRQRAAPPLVATVQVNAHANAHTNTPIVLGVAGLAGLAALPATRTRAPVRWARRAFVRLNSGVAGAGRVGLRAAGAVGRLGKRTLPGRMAGQAIGRLYPGRAARAVTRLRFSGRTMVRFNSTQAGRRIHPSASTKDIKDSASSPASASSSGGNGSGGSGGSSSGGSGNGNGKKSLKGELLFRMLVHRSVWGKPWGPGITQKHASYRVARVIQACRASGRSTPCASNDAAREAL